MSRYSAPRILGMHIHSTPATLHGIVRLAEQHVQLPDALMQSTACHVLLDVLSITYGYYVQTYSQQVLQWHLLLALLLHVDVLLTHDGVAQYLVAHLA